MWTRHLVGATVVALLLAFAPSASVAQTADRQVEDTHRFRDWAKLEDGSHYLVGQVGPDGAKRWVYYQRKLCATCRWRPYTKQLTNGVGRFQVRIAFPAPRNRSGATAATCRRAPTSRGTRVGSGWRAHARPVVRTRGLPGPPQG